MTSLHFDPWPFILCASYLIIIQYYLVTAFVLLKWTALYLFSSVQSLSRVRLFATPWTAARQASLSITNSRSSPKPMCIELVMPSSHLILCRPLLLLPPIPPSIRVFYLLLLLLLSSFSHVWLFATLWIAAHQASLSITNSWSSPKLMCIELVMPSSHLILCRPLLLLSPIPPSIRVFSNESTLHMRWPKYWSFSLSISPSNEHPGLVSFRMDWLDLLAAQGTCKSLLQLGWPKSLFGSFPNTLWKTLNKLFDQANKIS